MKVRSIRMTALTALIVGLAWSGAAQAYWGLDTTPTATINDSAATAQNPYTVKMSGFYVGNTLNASSKLSGSWASASLTQYSGNGQGMTTGTDSGSPYHALDNNGNTEGVLLSFSASTVLTSIGLGFVDSTAASPELACKTTATGVITYGTSCGSGKTSLGKTVDVSVFRWTGTSAPTLAGTAAGTMAGWELVGNYGDFILDTNNPYNQVNSAGKTSSWWLITAYNSGFTQSAATESRGSLTNGDDYFKLFAAAGNKCTGSVDANGVCGGTTVKVPEPATLALAGVALIGVAGLRRRQSKSAA